MSEELARRAVACKHWRWMPGMRSVSHGGHSRRLDPPSNARGLHPWWTWSQGECGEGLPDLTDPCTLGGLLALVREAWDWPNAFACHDEIGWYVPNGQTGCSVEWQIEASDGERHETEAAALVAALEAAP